MAQSTSATDTRVESIGSDEQPATSDVPKRISVAENITIGSDTTATSYVNGVPNRISVAENTGSDELATSDANGVPKRISMAEKNASDELALAALNVNFVSKPIAEAENVGADKPATSDVNGVRASSLKVKTEADASKKKMSVKAPSDSEEHDLNHFPLENNPVYNYIDAINKLNEYPTLKIRREGKYYLSMKNTIVEQHPRVRWTKSGKVIPQQPRAEPLGPIENIFRRFCEEVLCITRANLLPLSSQGERHLIWVSRLKAKHIIKALNGNGCYIVNRFPGDVFLKDKQVMGVTMRKYMLERRNTCFWKCGAPRDGYVDEEDEDDGQSEDITYRICQHMVQSMRTDKEGCNDSACFNFEKRACRHFDVFIPEVQSFCLYNALQDFSNRLNDDLKGQMFICKPSYLYKGLGFRFFTQGAEFEQFYHMSIGKETSRHDFLVQRVVSDPFLFEGCKVDVRAFLLILTLRHRRVLAFVNPGFCRLASMPYEELSEKQETEDEPDEPLSLKEKKRKQAEKLQRNLQMLVCTYQTDKERAERAKRIEKKQLFSDEEDRSRPLEEVFSDKAQLATVRKQIKHIGQRLAEGIEKRIWDAFGCYQIFSMDMCVDANDKVWLLEVNSHPMSEVDVLSPTQRVHVPAVMMESLGLVVECMYKSTHGLRLRKSPVDEFKETGFLFARNFEMVFSTLARRRTNYRHPRPPRDNGPPFYERVDKVDSLLSKAARHRSALEDLKRKHLAEKSQLKRQRESKKEEES